MRCSVSPQIRPVNYPTQLTFPCVCARRDCLPRPATVQLPEQDLERNLWPARILRGRRTQGSFYLPSPIEIDRNVPLDAGLMMSLADGLDYPVPLPTLDTAVENMKRAKEIGGTKYD